jgi:hypothetical protein
MLCLFLGYRFLKGRRLLRNMVLMAKLLLCDCYSVRCLLDIVDVGYGWSNFGPIVCEFFPLLLVYVLFFLVILLLGNHEGYVLARIPNT